MKQRRCYVEELALPGALSTQDQPLIRPFSLSHKKLIELVEQSIYFPDRLLEWKSRGLGDLKKKVEGKTPEDIGLLL